MQSSSTISCPPPSSASTFPISSQNDVPYSNQSFAVFIKSTLASNLEFLSLLITSHHYFFTLGTFYSPHNFDTAFGLFKNHITFLSPTILPNLILVGDFNIGLLKSSSLSKSLIEFTNFLGLNQIICKPTHFSHTGSPSLIDVVFVSSDLSCHSFVLPPITSLIIYPSFFLCL